MENQVGDNSRMCILRKADRFSQNSTKYLLLEAMRPKNFKYQNPDTSHFGCDINFCSLQ